MRGLIRTAMLGHCCFLLAVFPAFAVAGDVRFQSFGASELPMLRDDGVVISHGPVGVCGAASTQHSTVFDGAGRSISGFDAGAGCAGEGASVRGGSENSFNGPFSSVWTSWLRFPSPVSVTLDGQIAVPGSSGSATIDLRGADGGLLRTLVTPLVETGDGATLSRLESTVRGAVVTPLAGGGYITVARSVTFRSDAQGSLVSGWGNHGYLEFGDDVGARSAVAVFPDGTMARVADASIEWYDISGQRDVAKTAVTAAALGSKFRVTSLATGLGFDGLLAFGVQGSTVPVVGATKLATALAMQIREDGTFNPDFGDSAGMLRFPVGLWITFLSVDRLVDGRPSITVDTAGRILISLRYVVAGDESLVLTRLLADGHRDTSYGRQKWNRSSLRGVTVVPIQIGAAAGMPVPPLNELSESAGSARVLTRRNVADCSADRTKSRKAFQLRMSWLVNARGDEPVLSRPVLVTIADAGVDSRSAWVGLDHTRMYGPAKDTAVGTSGCDEVSLGAGDDRFVAGGGNDLVEGGAGNDTIYGGLGADELYGGFRFQPLSAKGIGVFSSGQERDVLHGGAGNDFLGGVAGPARLYGDSGNDRLEGVAAGVIMSGGLGNDIIIGGGNGAVLDGGAGRDVIRATARREKIFGGPGNDLIIGDQYAYDAYALPRSYKSAADYVDCGPGRDVAYVIKGSTTVNCESVKFIL